MNYDALRKIVELALSEDLISACDITTDNTIPQDLTVSFAVNTREATVLCVEPLAKIIFERAGIEYHLRKNDGDHVLQDECVIRGHGNARTLLKMERTFLNFTQRSCAVATMTRQFVNAISHTEVKIRGTRKTTPGMRCVEKYAIEIGGGENYRDSLSESILIKDNHIAICGGVTAAVCSLKKSLGNKYVMIECDTFAQVKEAVSVHVDSILLDNMSVEAMKKCVQYVRNSSPHIKIDASGGVTLATVREIAETGVDSVSVGMLTHSAMSVDIGVDIEIMV